MKSLGGFDFGDGGLGGFHHVLGGDAEVDEVLSTVALQTELLDGDRLAVGTEVLVPRHGNAGLDGDASLDTGRKHGLLVLGVLLLEPFKGRHGDHAGLDAFLSEGLGGLDGQLDFGTGGHQDDIRSAFGVDQDISALADTVLGLGSGLGENRDALTGQHHGSRQRVLLLEEVAVGFGGLEGIGRANDLKLRDSAEGSKVLNRLVGRAILADGDGVVRPHVQVRNLHEGGQTNGGTLVVGEHEEGAAERTGVGAQQDAVGNAAHGELAHAEVQLTTELVADRPLLGGALSRSEGGSALEVGLVGATEVGGAAPEFRHDSSDGIEHRAGGATGGDTLSDLEGGLKVIDGLVEAFRQLAGLDAVVQGSLVRVGLAPCVELLVPFLVGLETALSNLAGVSQSLFVNVEVLCRIVAEDFLEAGNGLGAQLGAVRGRIVGLARGRPSNQGVDLDELRLIRSSGLGLGDNVGQTLDVLLVGAVGLDEAELVGAPGWCRLRSGCGWRRRSR